MLARTVVRTVWVGHEWGASGDSNLQQRSESLPVSCESQSAVTDTLGEDQRPTHTDTQTDGQTDGLTDTQTSFILFLLPFIPPSSISSFSLHLFSPPPKLGERPGGGIPP